MAEIELGIEGMSCGHCRMAVEKALQNVPGVSQAEVDLARQKARVVYDAHKVDRQTLVSAIEEAGYRVVGQ